MPQGSRYVRNGEMQTRSEQINVKMDQDKPLQVMVDLCIVPLGVGVSLSPYIAECEKLIREAGLSHCLHAYGTNIEGDWDTVFETVKRCHEAVHAMGAPRITTTLKVGTRIDRPQSLHDKVASVEEKLNGAKCAGTQ
ncbi:MAG: hypothetical protein AMXMBFR84_36140 [Candidatus Hydrogenedentota bacterium]